MEESHGTLARLKPLVPRSVKRAARQAIRNLAFRRALRRLVRLPVGEVPNRQLLIDLQAGWGNEGFAARTDYLEEVASHFGFSEMEFRRIKATNLGPDAGDGAAKDWLALRARVNRSSGFSYALHRDGSLLRVDKCHWSTGGIVTDDYVT